MRDLDFVSGRFFDLEVPRDKRYLLRYFTNDLQRAFLRYHLVFGDHANFVDHTGMHCSPGLLDRLARRYRRLVRTHDEAKAELTERGMATLQEIESGKYTLTRHKIS